MPHPIFLLLLLLHSATSSDLKFREAPQYYNSPNCPKPSPLSSDACSIPADHVNVAMTLDLPYLRGSMAAIHSVLQHSSCPESIRFHFVASSSIPRLNKTISSSFPSLNYAIYPFDDSAVSGLISTSIRSALDRPLNYARSYLPRLLTCVGGRLHVRVCLDGGYHVADETSQSASDFRPSARQLWGPPVGTIELGLIGCKNLLPMKAVDGKGITDAYAVAKYGPKWARTRTVPVSFDPSWNEQYTWQVHDPCTVLTVGVFDESDGSKDSTSHPMGKIRIRISTLESNRRYR